MTTKVEPLYNCIACDQTSLELILDLGNQPPANAYKSTPLQPEEIFPLGINRCTHCYHAQLTHRVDASALFANYAYMSGISETTMVFFQWFAEMSLSKFDIMPTAVLDIGCNDGSQLDFYAKLNIETWGVDPATTLYPTSSKRHHIICDFYSASLISREFELIIIQNAFAHTSDQFQMLQDIKTNLSDRGLLFIVTSQADMFKYGEFDTIYHEHLSFYNINSMNTICNRAGLFLVDVMRHPIHGSSYIFIISKHPSPLSKTTSLIELERKSGVYDVVKLSEFSKKAYVLAHMVRDYITQSNIPVIGYSAPAKGNVFINFAQLTIPFVIDDTPLKQDKYIPGTNILIRSPEAFVDIERYDAVCFIIFAWNFYDEIKHKIQSYRQNKHDKFLTYFPVFSVEE
jgi:hypothetical protein